VRAASTCAEDGLEVLNLPHDVISASAVKQQHHLQISLSEADELSDIGKQSSQEPTMTVPSPRTPKGSQRSFPWRRLVAEKQLITGILSTGSLLPTSQKDLVAMPVETDAGKSFSSLCF